MSGESLQAAIQARFPSVQPIPKAADQTRGSELYLQVPTDMLIPLCEFLKSDSMWTFDFLSFITSIDWKDRFDVVYYMASTLHKDKLVLKVTTSHDQPSVPSISTIWPTADWQEREVFDLMGISFTGHYNLRRILLPDDWVGYPLRKDYVAKPDRFD